MTQCYIDRLIKTYPSISEIWLFGSRANDTAEPQSDWDYLVYADDASVLNALCQDKAYHDAGIDLFIVVDDDHALKPWTDPDGTSKKLALGSDPGGLAWKALSDTEAQYRATRKRNPDDPGDIAVDTHTKKARRVYPR